MATLNDGAKPSPEELEKTFYYDSRQADVSEKEAFSTSISVVAKYWLLASLIIAVIVLIVNLLN